MLNCSFVGLGDLCPSFELFIGVIALFLCFVVSFRLGCLLVGCFPDGIFD